MCGRFTLASEPKLIERRFGAKFVTTDWRPTYNAAPSQLLPIIRTYAPQHIELARWGFWPEEWKRSASARPQINARLETAAEKRMFASSFAGRHCLVLADGYYEWKTIAGRKQPFRFTLKSGEPFAMAGIYARENGEDGPVNFAILTTAANDTVRPIHDRMPVLLPLGHEKHWLVPGGAMILSPFPSELMTSYPVTTRMNKASFNEPDAITPLSPVIS